MTQVGDVFKLKELRQFRSFCCSSTPLIALEVGTVFTLTRILEKADHSHGDMTLDYSPAWDQEFTTDSGIVFYTSLTLSNVWVKLSPLEQLAMVAE